jgi:hypothetical protein
MKRVTGKKTTLASATIMRNLRNAGTSADFETIPSALSDIPYLACGQTYRKRPDLNEWIKRSID